MIWIVEIKILIKDWIKQWNFFFLLNLVDWKSTFSLKNIGSHLNRNKGKNYFCVLIICHLQISNLVCNGKSTFALKPQGYILFLHFTTKLGQATNQLSNNFFWKEIENHRLHLQQFKQSESCSEGYWGPIWLAYMPHGSTWEEFTLIQAALPEFHLQSKVKLLQGLIMGTPLLGLVSL